MRELRIPLENDPVSLLLVDEQGTGTNVVS